MSDYQGLVTKWNTAAAKLSHSGEAEDAAEIFAYESCANELAEVIARNVQPSPEVVHKFGPLVPDGSPLGVGYQCFEADNLAKFFHETYERLAPQFGYETRKESAKPWSDVPLKNKRLMIAVCAEVLKVARPVQQPATEPWPKCDYTGAPSLDPKQCCRCETCQKFASALALRDVPQGHSEIFKPDHVFDQFAEMWRCASCYQAWLRNAISHCCCEEFNQRILAARQVPVGPEGKK